MTDFLILPLFVVHLLTVKVASTGPLIVIWLDHRSTKGDEVAYRTARFLAWKSLALFIVGGLVGLGIGTLRWSPSYQEILNFFPRKIYFGAWEILFSLVLMLIVAIWLSRPRGESRSAFWVRAIFGVLAATNLLYHFPVLFTVISDVAAGHTKVTGPVSPAEFRELIANGSVMSRTLHFWFSGFAVTGAALLLYATRELRRTDGKEPMKVARWGSRIALIATILQFPIGVWVVLKLPGGSQQKLLGQDIVSTCLLGLSIFAALTLLQTLAAIAFGDNDRRNLTKAPAYLFVVVAFMTVVLQRLD